MKKMIALVACLFLAWGAVQACASQGSAWAEPGVALQVHYAGSDRVAPAGSPLNAILALPVTQEFKRQITDKLALAPQQWFQALLDRKNQKDRLSPLAEDLFKRESVFQLSPAVGGEPGAWGVGVRLGADRVPIWSTNLWQFFGDVKGMKPTVLPTREMRGWEASLTGSKLVFRLVFSGDWCVAGMGPNAAAVARLTETIALKKGAPLADGAWLSVHADLAGLKRSRLPGLMAVLPVPEKTVFEGSLAWKNNGVRTTASIDFPTDVKWEMEPWRTPTELIRDPLVSFTAIQGIRPWIASLGWIQKMGLAPVPNQCFIWAQSEVPFLTYAAAPIKGAPSVFNRIAPHVPSAIWDHVLGFKVGDIAMQTNKAALGWTGLPLLAPFLRPETTSGGEYLYAGMFHVVEATNAAPAELFSQLTTKTNLLVYEWELSQERLGQWHIFSQIKELATPASVETPFDADRTNACVQPWIAGAGPQLGNTITAITVQSPRKLALTRQSNTGLDGMELLKLIQWLDNSQFPLFGKSFLPKK